MRVYRVWEPIRLYHPKRYCYRDIRIGVFAQCEGDFMS
jgi:hypothetical protein